MPSTSSHRAALTHFPLECACQYPRSSTSDLPNGGSSSPAAADCECILRTRPATSQSRHRPAESAVTILVARGSVATHNTLSPSPWPA